MAKGKRTKTYTAWVNMRTRCTRRVSPDWPNYGGRGITVCERWKVFSNFLEDMGESPSGMELDRIDNDRGYDKDNCRWVTKSENIRNRRRTRWIEFNGEKRTLQEWANLRGISNSLLIYRLKAGWSTEQALTEPAKYGRKLK